MPTLTALRRALIAILAAPATITAQTIAESADGTSSFLVRGAGIALVNFADASVKVGYTRVLSTNPWRFGTELKAKGSNGFVTLFDKDSPLQFDGSLFLGRLWEAQHGDDVITAQWATVQLTGSRASYSLVSGSGDGVALSDTLFSAVSVRGYYNAMYNVRAFHGDVRLGLSGGYGQASNYSSLKKVRLCDRQVSANEGARVVESCHDARSGAYEERAVGSGAADLMWIPAALSQRIGIDAMGRYDGSRDENPTSVGLGWFFLKSGAPSVVLGGVTAEWRRGAKARVGLQTGIAF